MGTVGVQEMIVIFLVALVLFGPKKLPELGKTIGKAITEFRRASSDLKATFEREMQNLERENETLKEATQSVATEIQGHAAIQGSTSEYSYPYYDDSVYGTDTTPNSTSHSSEPQPSTVSASEVPGAESTGNTAIAGHEPAAAESLHPVEGTVPRAEMSRSDAAEKLAVSIEPGPALETPQHS